MSHIALWNVSFILGAILHCATILYSSDVWILMFVVHFLTRESIFSFHVVLWLGKLQMLVMCLAPLSRLDEAVALIQLYHVVNPEAKCVTAKFEPGQEHKFIQVMLFVVYFMFRVLGFSFQMWFVWDCSCNVKIKVWICCCFLSSSSLCSSGGGHCDDNDNNNSLFHSVI